MTLTALAIEHPLARLKSRTAEGETEIEKLEIEAGLIKSQEFKIRLFHSTLAAYPWLTMISHGYAAK